MTVLFVIVDTSAFFLCSSDVARMLFSTWLRSSPLRAGNMRRIALSACPVRHQTHRRELLSMLFSSLKCLRCSLASFVRGVRGSWALFSMIVLIVWESSSNEHSKCHASVLWCVCRAFACGGGKALRMHSFSNSGLCCVA